MDIPMLLPSLGSSDAPMLLPMSESLEMPQRLARTQTLDIPDLLARLDSSDLPMLPCSESSDVPGNYELSEVDPLTRRETNESSLAIEEELDSDGVGNRIRPGDGMGLAETFSEAFDLLSLTERSDSRLVACQEHADSDPGEVDIDLAAANAHSPNRRQSVPAYTMTERERARSFGALSESTSTAFHYVEPYAVSGLVQRADAALNLLCRASADNALAALMAGQGLTRNEAAIHLAERTVDGTVAALMSTHNISEAEALEHLAQCTVNGEVPAALASGSLEMSPQSTGVLAMLAQEAMAGSKPRTAAQDSCPVSPAALRASAALELLCNGSADGALATLVNKQGLTRQDAAALLAKKTADGTVAALASTCGVSDTDALEQVAQMSVDGTLLDAPAVLGVSADQPLSAHAMGALTMLAQEAVAGSPRDHAIEQESQPVSAAAQRASGALKLLCSGSADGALATLMSQQGLTREDSASLLAEKTADGTVATLASAHGVTDAEALEKVAEMSAAGTLPASVAAAGATSGRPLSPLSPHAMLALATLAQEAVAGLPPSNAAEPGLGLPPKEQTNADDSSLLESLVETYGMRKSEAMQLVAAKSADGSLSTAIGEGVEPAAKGPAKRSVTRTRTAMLDQDSPDSVMETLQQELSKRPPTPPGAEKIPAVPEERLKHVLPPTIPAEKHSLDAPEAAPEKTIRPELRMYRGDGDETIKPQPAPPKLSLETQGMASTQTPGAAVKLVENGALPSSRSGRSTARSTPGRKDQLPFSPTPRSVPLPMFGKFTPRHKRTEVQRIEELERQLQDRDMKMREISAQLKMLSDIILTSSQT